MSKGIRVDHLGNGFKTQNEMCKCWNINPTTFRYNISQGRSVEEALTTKQETGCADHLGNKFASKNQMCKHYGIAMHTFSNRLDKGWSLEKALTTKRNGIDKKKKECTDHLGNKFKSKTEMCEYYGVNIATLGSRLESGYSLEEALTKKHRLIEEVEDHLGNKYESVKSLCEAYDIQVSTYHRRKHRGWSIEDILTRIERHNYVKDFEGNEFKNLKEMCEFHGYNYNTVKERLKKGWCLERAITEPLKRKDKSIWVNGVRIGKMIYREGEIDYYLCQYDEVEEVLSLEELKENMNFLRKVL